MNGYILYNIFNDAMNEHLLIYLHYFSTTFLILQYSCKVFKGIIECLNIH